MLKLQFKSTVQLQPLKGFVCGLMVGSGYSSNGHHCPQQLASEQPDGHLRMSE